MMPLIDFDLDDPAAMRAAYIQVYYSCFGRTTALDEAILSRFDAEKREPTVEDVKRLYEIAEGLGKVLDKLP